MLVLTGINVIGVKSGVRTAVFLAITKTLPLLIFIAVGIFYVSTESRDLGRRQAGRPERLGDAVLLLLFAYAGFENTAAPAGEFKNPRRDVPFALIVQIVIVTLIYSARAVGGPRNPPRRGGLADPARRRRRASSWAAGAAC